MRVVIFGGTGTLGTETIRQLLEFPHLKSIVSVSRDELKQKQMAGKLKDPRLTFHIADIRDADATLRSIPDGTDLVFHFAALKHVDMGEKFPVEFIKTNTLGTVNVANASIDKNVSYCILSSTDKAVDPINAYGMTKGLAEKILFSLNDTPNCPTRFSVYRWGNVFGSRGSAIEAFRASLSQRQEVDLTHPEMTRFWIRIEDAVRFMLSTYPSASRTGAMIPPIKCCKLTRIIDEIAQCLGVLNYQVNNMGMRPGEKIHEVLGSLHTGKIPFSSENSVQMSDKEIREMVMEAVL